MIVEPSAANIERAATLLRAGELVAFPTETVYGLGANALDASAVAKIYALKGRPSHNPLIVHLSSVSEFPRFTHCSPQQEAWLRALAPFQPGPLTVVLPKNEFIPSIVSAGGATVALRIPSHPVAQQLLKSAALPIAAPSANPSNYVSPTTACHVEESFGERAPFTLDGGPCGCGLESTVLSLIGPKPRILRPGIITSEQLEAVLGEVETMPTASEQNQATFLESPGMLSLHYAPHAQVVFLDECDRLLLGGKSFSQICFSSDSDRLPGARNTLILSNVGDLYEVAAGLFGALRELDKPGCDLIVVERPVDSGIGRAILDRLIRAAKPR